VQNAQTGATYTFVAGDAQLKMVTLDYATAVNATIDGSVFAAGDVVNVLQKGAGQVTFVQGSGMTLRSSGSKLKLTGQYSVGGFWCESSSVCYVFGDITA
jgi:hypothetical protein